MNQIVGNTYLKAKKSKPSSKFSPINLEEIIKFLASIMFMVIKKLPAEKDYWATNSLGDGMIKILFPNRYRWIFIKKTVSNPSAELNEKGKLAKVRPFHEYVNTTVKSIGN